VIELRDGKAATPDLAQDIVDYCQGRLGRLKLPRTVVFDERLPRTPPASCCDGN
jgi:acyl-coenzyme A synthetase/AMP-(fatty) acid ligase